MSSNEHLKRWGRKNKNIGAKTLLFLAPVFFYINSFFPAYKVEQKEGQTSTAIIVWKK